MLETLEPISREDWIEWKRNPVTKRFMLMGYQAVNELILTTAKLAGLDNTKDNYRRGIIEGMLAVLEAKPEGEEDDD